MAATEMSEAIKAYSMAAMPRLSVTSLRSRSMSRPPICCASIWPRTGWGRGRIRPRAAMGQWLGGQSDQADLAAVARLAAMRGAAVAVEALRVRIGVDAEWLDCPDSRGRQAHGDVTFQVELELAIEPVGKEAPIVRDITGQHVEQVAADLITAGGDAWPDRRRNQLTPGAEPLHGGDRCFADAEQRALPPGVGGADHLGFAVGEQDRCAVRRQNAEQEPWPVGDKGVALWSVLLTPVPGDVDCLRMHLVDGDQPRAGQHGVDGQLAVARDRLAVVAAAPASVEPG